MVIIMKLQLTSLPHFFQRILLATLCFSLLLLATGCFKLIDSEESSTISSESETSASSAETTDPTATVAPETTAITTTETTESETSSEPTLLTDINGIEISTSFAYMVSFDSSTGLAEFDYFDKLTGQEAIDWLVAHEGYTQADAEDYVNGFVDTEFVEKNINPQLRTIDMNTVPITTNVSVEGYLELPGVPLTYSEFVTRINQFLHTPSNYSVTRITVENEVIVELIVSVFMA